MLRANYDPILEVLHESYRYYLLWEIASIWLVFRELVWELNYSPVGSHVGIQLIASFGVYLFDNVDLDDYQVVWV